MVQAKKNKLVLFWEKALGDSVKAARASKSLQRQAEIDVAKAQEDFETSKDAFDKAKMDAKDNPKEGFQKIVKTHRAMVVEKKDFDNAIEIYEALFEEKPRLLT